mmetsp:Transcript_22574/g.52572  ORF Transcript_22574/g.52572 Transcript_22574/m.52572 type:complete len:555 (-) Transcript_22574:95-1759(-)|eukprot:CAMPEP_0178437782 /NCGR_PEP_ID=MMETSP0689_2-20121128/35196_1 /TAXON_ID=160604 /ORGANISM="Amphidinium massartii, Strain CS-259" /LENGTH=554 /DNA_ID=CAMNT_0020060047 /DNA_START=64 /DNA_END=1728 /DNA_ORIENTATION=+
MSLGFASRGYSTAMSACRVAKSRTSGAGSQRLFASAALQQTTPSANATASFPAMGTSFTENVGKVEEVRMRYAAPSSDGLEVGFTDGTEYRFSANWLRSLIAGQGISQQGPSTVARSTLSQGAIGVTVEWGADALKYSTFDANMLRAFADKVAEPVTSTKSIDSPFQGPSVWTGPELLASRWWGHMLSDADIEDLKNATREAAKKVEWRAECVPEIFPKENFPLGESMVKKLEALSEEIEFGKGLAMIRNMPVNDPDLSEEDLAIMYIGISAHIGHVVMQSSSGLRSVSRGYGMPLGRIQAEMTGETPKGGLQTNNHFRLHTDRCDVISLMSLRTAPKGGASRVCSAPAVYNAILERSPELAKALTEPIDRIWEGEKGYFTLPVIGKTPSGQCTTQISPSYVENAQFLEGTKKATQAQIAALDAIEEIGMELGVEFVMKPGMLYFLNNHQVYHGRGNWAVTDGEAGGQWGKEGRLLFRTWISPYNSRKLPDTEEYRNVWGSVDGGKPRGGWDQAVKTGEVPKPKMPDDHVYYSLYSDRVQKHSMNGHCGTVIEY